MNTNYFMIIVIVAFAILVLIKKLLDKEDAKDASKKLLMYRKKDRVMNDSEQAFYLSLQKQLGDSYVVLSKVRIEDFVLTQKEGLTPGEVTGLRNRIKSDHVDFLICDIVTTRPLLAIELDGSSHSAQGSIESDHFKNELYDKIGLPLKRVRVGNDFEVVAKEMAEMLK